MGLQGNRRDGIPSGERKEFRLQLEERDGRYDIPTGEQDERKEFRLGLEECNVRDNVPPGEQKSSDRSKKIAM